MIDAAKLAPVTCVPFNLPARPVAAVILIRLVRGTGNDVHSASTSLHDCHLHRRVGSPRKRRDASGFPGRMVRRWRYLPKRMDDGDQERVYWSKRCTLRSEEGSLSDFKN